MIGELFHDLFVEEVRWHNEVMPDETAHSIAFHLREEADELLKSSSRANAGFLNDQGHAPINEAADVLICLLAWANRGPGLEALLNSAFAKIEINKKRTWRKDAVTGTYYHV